MTDIHEAATDRRDFCHELKTDPDVYQAVSNGHKTFEIRKMDRDFRVGDYLLLRETESTGEQMKAAENPAPLVYTGWEVRVRITYILRGPIYGLQDGWGILGIVLAQPAPAVGTDHAALLAEAEDEAPVAGSFRDLIQRLATALRESRTREQAAEKIIESALNTLPVGYIPNHTPETIPSRIADLMTRCAETDRVEDERDAAIARAEKAEAALADSNASLALCAENTAAADLAQEVECLKAEREAHACANIARAALAIGGGGA